jgi:predicted PurR-regulated permease PerM
MSEQIPPNISPRWSSTIKLVVALTLVAVLALLVISFRSILGPLLLGFIFSYLLYPLLDWIRRRLKLPWRIAVGLFFLFILIVALGLLTWGGIALVEQIQILVTFVQQTIASLPAFINSLSNVVYHIGPFTLDFSHLDLVAVSNQVLSFVQPLLSQLGTILGSVAAKAASLIGWSLFVLLVSFFILSETEGKPERLINIQVPGYGEDFRRLGHELGRIWNAFLRGQLTVTALWICVYTVVLAVLGVHYFFPLAILAGMARFFPYIGPTVTYTTMGLVAYFQGTTLFGLTPFIYVVVIIGVSLVIDNAMDSLITTRLMSNALKVHPAAVLVAALVAANLLGIIGIVLAAPVLASLKLFLNYTIYKMLDQDPWQQLNAETSSLHAAPPLFVRFLVYWSRFRESVQKKFFSGGRNKPVG